MKTQKPTIRSSSMPDLMACTNSVLNPDGLLPVEVDTGGATLVGDLVHAIAENLVKAGQFDLSTLNQLDEADRERGIAMAYNVLDVWREAAPHMPNPETEWAFKAELSHVILTGHIDVHHVDPARAFILDWKTGRQHEDHYHQMAAYAFGVWDKVGRPPVYTVYVSVVYLEDNSVHPYEFTVDDLLAWEKQVAHQVVQQRYTAGRKCGVCKFQDTCPAYRVFADNARKMLLQLADATVIPWEDLSPEERGQIVDNMYALQKAIDRVKLSVRGRVQRHGPLDVGAGKAMTLVETEERTLRPEEAMPILEERIGKDAIIRNIHLPLDAVLSEYASKAAKGRKTQARRELLAELEEAGAVTRRTVTRLFRRPIGEKVLDTNG